MSYYGGYGVVVIPRRRRRFDLREVTDLLISWIVLTIAFGAQALLAGSLVGLGVAGLAVATAFVAHELSHRQVARRYGLYARYRAWYAGLALALIIALISTRFFGSTFVFAAPGAVYVVPLYPAISPRAEARVAEAGPIANLAVAAALLVARSYLPLPWNYIASAVGNVNAWIAFFNLLPIPPLDGFKVIRTAPLDWVLMMAAAVALYFII